MAKEHVTEVFSSIGSLAWWLGYRDIAHNEGLTEFDIDERWDVAINPHREDMRDARGCNVPPKSMALYYNGWPAGVVTAHTGTISAGKVANEDALLDAIEKARHKAASESTP